jgi:hypothetical protein
LIFAVASQHVGELSPKADIDERDRHYVPKADIISGLVPAIST